MKRLLSDLLKSVNYKEILGNPEVQVNALESNSKKVKEGALFVAVKGTVNDGHQYINSALEAGAKVVFCEILPKEIDVEKATFVVVEDTTLVLGQLASLWYDEPSRKLKLVGVTGTNGKTTVATLLYRLFIKLGYNCGLLSTVGNYVQDKFYPTKLTTPDPLTINELLYEMVCSGCDYAFMEVSSHAIEQNRISGLSFAGGIFTNLTRDHLDYHGTVDNYIRAKKKFFDSLNVDAFALVNADDKNGTVMVQNSSAKHFTYSLNQMTDFKAMVLERHLEGTLVTFNDNELVLQFLGLFNVYNLLAVYGAACLLGQKTEDILPILSLLKPVEGRFEVIISKKGYIAVVDYAHTPDALVNVLETIRELLPEGGKLITIVGAGGNRDKGKRPIMAKEASKFSDQFILTSDNPRFEEPEDILKDMVEGVPVDKQSKMLQILDRAQAIKTGLMLAEKNDVVLIAGKGHETYQEIKGVRHHFDDREQVREFMNQEIV